LFFRINENKQILGLKEELEKLNLRHKAALELLGEREEQLEELKADLVDVKQLYKQQINELLSKIPL
jgi:TATA element modulatory factor